MSIQFSNQGRVAPTSMKFYTKFTREKTQDLKANTIVQEFPRTVFPSRHVTIWHNYELSNHDFLLSNDIFFVSFLFEYEYGDEDASIRRKGEYGGIFKVTLDRSEVNREVIVSHSVDVEKEYIR
jgi:hypothetical protein